MIQIFDYTSISNAEIEDMLYKITAHAGRTEAKRFESLSDERKQKVTFVLKNRAKRAKNADQPFDMFIVREIIDDAKRDLYFID